MFLCFIVCSIPGSGMHSYQNSEYMHGALVLCNV
jgi:hypothetical protein